MLTSQKFKAKNLHMVSDFINMRFTLQNNKLYLQQKARRKKIISSAAPTLQLQSTRSSSHHKKQVLIKTKSLFQVQKSIVKQTVNDAGPIDESVFQLRFVQKLSQEHIIIGNQYQINLIHLGNVLQGFIEVEHKWSLTLKGVAQSFSVERKFNLIGLASLDAVWIYKYDLKNDHKMPELVLSCPRTEKNQEIIQIRFIRNAGVFVIMKTKLEFYRLSWVCQKAQLLKSLEYIYEIDANMSVFRIPDAWDTTLNVYYYEKKPQSDKFNLWMQSFVILAGLQIPEVKKKVRIYSLEEQLKDRIKIFNYNAEICFIQFQNKLIAFKNGFVIDAVSTNIHQPSYFIRYVPSQRTLFHFLESVIDIYSLAMIQKSKPQKFKLMCRDCLQFSSKINGKLLDIVHLGHDKFAFFFQTSLSKSTSNNPNITYYFAVTEAADLKTKIDKIYPPLGQLDKYSLEQLYQKSSIAEKMGMTKRQAFLELWYRSGKSSITDFQILLSTRDFPTIQQEIQHKLKRQSMSVRQLLKIYSQCLNMLQQRVYSDSCSLQDLKQYASCHFLIRKLQMFRWVSSQQHNPDGVISMNIKDYYEYKELSLIPEIVKLISQYLTKPKSEYLLKLRAIFKFFRIICKMQYQQILTTIVQKCKLRILQILKVVPELLPYETGQNNDFQIHLWGLITEQQLDQNLFLAQLLTIDNRVSVQDFPKHLWFKRYLYSTHGVIKDVDKKSTIKYLSKKNNMQSIFYMFLCQVYHLNVFNNQLRDLITFVEMKYEFMPGHLRGKLELYFIMYSIFSEIDKKLLLSQFLRLRQHSLFKLYFQREKSQKGGFILKKIKPLYEQLLNKGKQVFNQGIYEYFSSEQSSVSDLKCILSKLNNQKNEFHLSSQHLYEVLINAIMHKIKVGSSQDTPIDEILVYIQNIPFPVHNDSIMTNLQYIQQINYESQILRKIKVNMTLYDIIKQGQKVIEMMVDYEIQRHEMERIRDYRNLRLHAYKILAQIQCRKSNIYGDSFHNYSLKIFLINIMGSNIDMIPLCKQLLNDKYLIEQFQIDNDFKQTIVMHVYQWKLSIKKQGPNPYCNHIQLITLLMGLLQPDNPKRKFIEASMRYAAIFTLPNFKIQYPLFPTFSYYPALADIEALFHQLVSEDLISLNLDLIFNVMIELKKLGQAQMKANFFIEGYQNKVKIQLHEIYLVRLVKERQLKLALDVVEQLLEIPNEYSFLNIVYPLLILQRTYQEVLYNTAVLLNRIISFTFNNPAELCCLLKRIYTQKFSNIELDNLLKRYLKKKEATQGYSITNPIFKQRFIQSNDPINQNNLLQICLQRILKINQVFRKNHSMQLVFRLMCHNPLSMAKWIWCKGSGINMKTFRAFISYMTVQVLFDADSTLKQAINVLEILNFKYTNTVFFSEILKFRQYLTSNALNYNLKGNYDQSQQKAIKLITQSIQILKHKRQQVQTKSIKVIRQNENADFQAYLQDPKLYQQRQVSEYVYSDKDDAYQDLNDQLSIKSKWRSRYQSNAELNSQGIILRKYEEIPLPTSIRHRKNSQYFPQMLDIEQNFKVTKQISLNNNSSSSSLRNYSFNLNGPQQNKIQRIIQDECQNMSSLVMINIESSKFGEGQHGLRLLSNLKKSQSIVLDDDQIRKSSQILQQSQEGQFVFTINVNKQIHKNPHQIINDILMTTVQGKSSIFDLSLLKTQSKIGDFRSYLKNVLAELYSMKNIPFQRVMKLFNAIVEEFKKQQKLNKQAIDMFKSLALFKTISSLSFDFRSALPSSILFLSNIDDAYDNFQQILMNGNNSLQVFSRLQFLQQVAGREWKEKFIVLLVLQKIDNIKDLKAKLHQKPSKNEELRLLKDLEMEQLRISALVDENDSLIEKLQLHSTKLRESEYETKKQLGQILKMCIDVIKIDSMSNI